MSKEEFLRYLKRKFGLCFDCKNAVFLGDGGLYCRKRKLMFYTKIRKCRYYEKEEAEGD